MPTDEQKTELVVNCNEQLDSWESQQCPSNFLKLATYIQHSKVQIHGYQSATGCISDSITPMKVQPDSSYRFLTP